MIYDNDYRSDPFLVTGQAGKSVYSSSKYRSPEIVIL